MNYIIWLPVYILVGDEIILLYAVLIFKYEEESWAIVESFRFLRGRINLLHVKHRFRVKWAHVEPQLCGLGQVNKLSEFVFLPV